MITKMTFIMLMIIGILITGCDKKDEVKAEVTVVETDLLNEQFPEAQQEIAETFGEIAQAGEKRIRSRQTQLGLAVLEGLPRLHLI